VNPSVLFASRSGASFVAALAIHLIAAASLSGRYLKISFTQQYPVTAMTVPELAAVLLACVGVMILRPQMWIIDRLGARSRRWVPSACALTMGVLGPQLVLAAAVLAQMPLDAWSRAAANVLFLASLAFLTSPFIGAFTAGGLVLMVYLGLVCALQMAPEIARWSPVVSSEAPDGRWGLAALCALAAVLVTVHTLGRTHRTWGRDLDLA
jgi:hypothetical protein